MEDIKLTARYGYEHTLKHVDGNKWQFIGDPKSTGRYRCIGWEGEFTAGISIQAFDPEGGPFLRVGGKINGKTIKSITSDGVFELE